MLHAHKNYCIAGKVEREGSIGGDLTSCNCDTEFKFDAFAAFPQMLVDLFAISCLFPASVSVIATITNRRIQIIISNLS